MVVLVMRREEVVEETDNWKQPMLHTRIMKTYHPMQMAATTSVTGGMSASSWCGNLSMNGRRVGDAVVS